MLVRPDSGFRFFLEAAGASKNGGPLHGREAEAPQVGARVPDEDLREEQRAGQHQGLHGEETGAFFCEFSEDFMENQ